jgi:hypothetical protein
MSSLPSIQVTVWTIEGYEGRFLEWDGETWQAFEYRNFRHWFSSPQALTREDIQALRGRFGAHPGSLEDKELLRTAPTTLQLYGQRPNAH